MLKQWIYFIGFISLAYFFNVAHCGGCGKGEAVGWTQWSSCTVTCSGGTRARSCTCVPSDTSTDTCTFGDNELEVCNENDCPGDDDNNAESVAAAIIILLLIILKWFPFLLG